MCTLCILYSTDIFVQKFLPVLKVDEKDAVALPYKHHVLFPYIFLYFNFSHLITIFLFRILLLEKTEEDDINFYTLHKGGHIIGNI